MEELKVTFEQLSAAYALLMQEHQVLQMQFEALKVDKVNERLNTLRQILDSPNMSEKVIKLATWHMTKILAKK